MIKIEDLDGLKLVDENYLASTEVVQQTLENAFQQGSQGWGVRPEISVVLYLARQLADSMTLASTAEEAQRMLKGAQMSGGRLKKQIESLDKANVKTEALALALTVKLAEVEAQLVKTTAAYEDAENELTTVEAQLASIDSQ